MGYGQVEGKAENDQRLGVWDKQSLGITREHELAVEGPYVMEWRHVSMNFLPFYYLN